MCMKPLTLEDRVVKCGHCIECLIARSKEWAFRVEAESKVAKSGYFITLTYSDVEVPLVFDEEYNPLTTLVKRDLQLFIKRMREHQARYSDWKIRYFANGEYGSKTKRAHYHGIFFNVEKKTKEKIHELWGKGFVKVGEVNAKTIRYVTNYMLMKDIDVIKPQAKPFVLMSRKPGIGANYIDDNSNYHYETKDPLCQMPGKIKQALPRYYAESIYDDIAEHTNRKIEHYKPYLEKMEKEAQEKEPLDPNAYIRRTKEHKAKIRKKRSKQNRKL